MCVCSAAQSCPTLCNTMDCSPPGSSVLEILQARIWEWVAISYSRGSSWPRDQTPTSCVSCIGRRILYYWAIVINQNIMLFGTMWDNRTELNFLVLSLVTIWASRTELSIYYLRSNNMYYIWLSCLLIVCFYCLIIRSVNLYIHWTVLKRTQ